MPRVPTLTLVECLATYRIVMDIIYHQPDFWAGVEDWKNVTAKYNLAGRDRHFLYRLRAVCQYVREAATLDLLISVTDLHTLGMSKMYSIWRYFCQQREMKKADYANILAPGQWLTIPVAGIEKLIHTSKPAERLEWLMKEEAKLDKELKRIRKERVALEKELGVK